MRIVADSHRYGSVRNVVFARNGMACSTQPLASSVGAQVMRDGGNAVDAAVAMAGAMALLEPTGNGLGSDAFFLVWTEGRLFGLNASGRAPGRLSARLVRELGFESVPYDGWIPVMVPGAVGGWCELNRRFGTMSLEKLWEPAVSYAYDGFPVSPNVALQWKLSYERFRREFEKYPALFGPWMDCFGRVPAPGDIFRNPDFGSTLQEIARTRGESFYRGEIMKKMVSFSDRTGGFLTEDDFASYHPNWVEPISARYRGYDVWEMPPNGHGITALMALKILEGFKLQEARVSEAALSELGLCEASMYKAGLCGANLTEAGLDEADLNEAGLAESGLHELSRLEAGMHESSRLEAGLNGSDFGGGKENADVYHLCIEAIKLAFADTRKYVADPEHMKTRVEDLLSEKYLGERRSLISLDRAINPEAGDPSCGGTVYYCTADGEGNMVSCIQSNYRGFGSGICIPGTGITLQDRGANFSLDPESDNCLEGGKRSYHTIIPGFLTKDGKPVGPFGVMGGFMQPQGHLQVMVNTIDFAMNPQEALDAPRFQWVGGKKVQLEKEVSEDIVSELRKRGHEIEVVESNLEMGRGQIIWRREDGVLCGGTESRADGSIAVV